VIVKKNKKKIPQYESLRRERGRERQTERLEEWLKL
jgi:hypothetical protein